MAFLPKTRPAQSEAEFFRTPEMDEEDAHQAGVQLASDLWAKILLFAEFDNIERSEPARSQMIFEANFFAAAYCTYHAENWYSEEPLRKKFVEGLKGQFALVLAVSVDPPPDYNSLVDVQSDYSSLIDLRERQYQAIRASYTRFTRLFFGKTFVDGVFLAERIQFALGQHRAVTSAPTLAHFVKRVVREVHNASAVPSRSVAPVEVLVILATVSVAVGILPLPYGFYMLLRLIICLAAGVGFVRAWEERRTGWLWIYGVLAVLYNPVLPIHLLLRPLWIVANLVTIVLLWVGLSKFGDLLPGQKDATQEEVLDAPIELEPQGDIVNDRVAARSFNRAVQGYVRARLRQEWGKRPRSLATCLRLLWGVSLNLCATLQLWLADTWSGGSR